MSHSCSLHIIILIIVLPCFLWAQQPYMRQITDEDGLPSLTVHDIHQDQRDYLWMGTDKGLCRYDGQSFQYYQLPELERNSIRQIFEDQGGKIWCVNSAQELFYVHQDKLQLLSVVDSFLNGEKALAYELSKDQQLWVLSPKQLLRLNIDSSSVQERIALQHTYKHLLSDQNNKLWLYSSSDLYQLTDNNSEYRISLAEQALQNIQLIKGTERLFLLQYTSNKNITKLYAFDQQKIQKISTTLELLPKGLLEDQESKLWVYGHGGIFLFQSSTDNTPQQILPRTTVLSVLQDREGNHWIATEGAGVFFMPQPEIQYFSRENSNLNVSKVRKLIQHKDHLILGTDEMYIPVFSLSQKKSTVQYPSPQLAHLEAMHWDESSDALFIFQQGLYRFDQVGQAPKKFLQTDAQVWDIKSLDSTHLLLASSAGVLLVRKDFQALENKALEQLGFAWHRLSPELARIFRKQNCKSIWVENPQKLWLGYQDSLFQCQSSICQGILDRDQNPIRVRVMTATDDEVLWLSTMSQGLLGLQEGKIRYSFDQSNGLRSTHIQCLVADGNSLWLGSDQGIQHLNANHESFSTYDKQDGLVSNEIEDLLVFDGQVWAASPLGLIHFNQKISSINAYPPPIYWLHFKVNGLEYPFKDQYQLSYQENHISLGFQGIAYRSMGNFRYKYRLKGFSDAWYYVNAEQKELRFSALPPGKYLLEIRALNEDGVLSTQALRISFSIHYPFWQTWWFIASVVAALTILISSILWWRLLIKQRFTSKINQLKIKALQAQMNPHFVFNALNAIQTLMLTDDIELAMGYLTKFAKLILLIFNMSSKSSIELTEEIRFLELYTDLEKLRFGDKVEVEFIVDDQLYEEEYFIPPLIIQPIIENSFKHGLLHKTTKGKLKIHLQMDGDLLYVLVEDNGVGRKKAAQLNQWRDQDKKKSAALQITKDRLQLLRSVKRRPNNPKITDLTDTQGHAQGTRVEIWVPFQIHEVIAEDLKFNES